ncbi:MAG: hypothetical protein ACLP50_23880 [Solirubrobacteraceae bacterium]
MAAALVASTAVLAFAAGSASASPVAGSVTSAGSHGVGPLTMKYAKAEHWTFEVEYDAEAYYGAVKCKGKHEVNEKKGYPGTETQGGRDVEHCKSTTGKPLVGLMPGETVLLGMGEFPGSSGWASDDPALGGEQTTDIEYKVSSNAKSFKVVAYYPNS